MQMFCGSYVFECITGAVRKETTCLISSFSFDASLPSLNLNGSLSISFSPQSTADFVYNERMLEEARADDSKLRQLAFTLQSQLKKLPSAAGLLNLDSHQEGGETNEKLKGIEGVYQAEHLENEAPQKRRKGVTLLSQFIGE